MNRPTRPSDVVVPHQLRWHGILAVTASYLVSRVLCATLRISIKGNAQAISKFSEGPVILCMWHNRLVLGFPIFRRFFLTPQPHRRVATIVSASKDGAMLARFFEHHAVQPVRGSSSRRGARALRELTRWADKGYDLAITPDGPRGPKYVVQGGVITLAQLTGLPIVPFLAQIHSKKIFDSWDGFQMPLPFSRCDVHVGEFLQVPRGADSEECEAARYTLEQRMLDLTID